MAKESRDWNKLISHPIKKGSSDDHGNQLDWKGNATKKPDIRLKTFFFKKNISYQFP